MLVLLSTARSSQLNNPRRPFLLVEGLLLAVIRGFQGQDGEPTV